MSHSPFPISGSVAFVTGANRGIGRAITEALLERGAKKVYAAARNTAQLKDLIKSSGGRVEAVELDVTNPSHIEAAAAKAGNVNLVINNAGLANLIEPLGPETIASAKREFDVNVFGPLAIAQAFAPALAKSGIAGRPGAIVNINSVASLSNFTSLLTYSASKAAAHSITQGIRAVLASKGVSVFGVYPGPVDTDMAEEIDLPKATPQSVAKRILDGIETGEHYIFPDDYAADFGRRHFADPRAFEAELAASPAEA